jgi:hypothetical protein
MRRFVRGHQFKGNTYGQKSYDLSTILEQVEPVRPFCLCGCGERLEVPRFMRQKGYGINSILSRWKEHPFKPKHGIWQTRTETFVSKLGSLSPDSLGLIYGTLLGDCAITYPNKHSRFPRLSWTHGMLQREWLEYKATRLSELRPKLRVAPNKGFGDESICCNTACHPQLIDVFAQVKPEGIKKRVSLDWLNCITSEGLAWWYMDDGSLSLSPQGSPRIQFHTEGYSAEENQLIACWFTSRGYPAKVQACRNVHRNTCYQIVSLGANASRKLLENLQPYAIPTMAYKFGGGRICPPRWS